MARPRKQAKRTAKGRLSRAAAAKFDRGTEQAQARKERYRGNGYDAIGRAYEAGLLGWEAGKQKDEEGRPSARAKSLMDMARSINRVYWCAYEVGGIGCTLGSAQVTSVHFGPPIRGLDDPRQEQWLVRMLALVQPAERALFEQVVIDPMPDEGPRWLDAMLTKGPRGRAKLSATEQARIKLVVDCLERMLG